MQKREQQQKAWKEIFRLANTESKYTANGLMLFNDDCQKTFIKAWPNEALGTNALKTTCWLEMVHFGKINLLTYLITQMIFLLKKTLLPNSIMLLHLWRKDRT